MSFLGIGPLELVFFVIIALFLFKPEDLAAAGRKLGRFLYRMKNSEFWRSVTEMRTKATEVGKELLEESGVKEVQQDLEMMPDLDEFRRELDDFGFKSNTSKPMSVNKPLDIQTEQVVNEND